MDVYTIKTEVTAFEVGKVEGRMVYPLDPKKGTPTAVTAKFLLEFNTKERGYVVINPNGSMDFVTKAVFEKDYKPVKVASVEPKVKAKTKPKVVDKQAEAEDTTEE